MRTLLFAAFVAMSANAAAAAQQPARGADDTAVREVIAKYMAARAARDEAAVAALFTADADQFTTSGDWRRGRDRIREGTAESSKTNPGTRQIAVEAVRFVTPDVAIADGRYDIASPGGAPARRMWTTIVLVRTPAGWRISAIRNMAPTAQ